MPFLHTETRTRSVVKSLTYRVLIVCTDLITIYLMTGNGKIALAFTLVSNIVTTIGYFFHERVWARVRWGLEPSLTEER